MNMLNFLKKDGSVLIVTACLFLGVTFYIVYLKGSHPKIETPTQETHSDYYSFDQIEKEKCLSGGRAWQTSKYVDGAGTCIDAPKIVFKAEVINKSVCLSTYKNGEYLPGLLTCEKPESSSDEDFVKAAKKAKASVQEELDLMERSQKLNADMTAEVNK